MNVCRGRKRLAAVGIFFLSTMLICASSTAFMSSPEEPLLVQRYEPRRLQSLDETSNSTATAAPAGSITNVYNAMEVSLGIYSEGGSSVPTRHLCCLELPPSNCFMHLFFPSLIPLLIRASPSSTPPSPALIRSAIPPSPSNSLPLSLSLSLPPSLSLSLSRERERG